MMKNSWGSPAEAMGINGLQSNEMRTNKFKSVLYKVFIICFIHMSLMRVSLLTVMLLFSFAGYGQIEQKEFKGEIYKLLPDKFDLYTEDAKYQFYLRYFTMGIISVAYKHGEELLDGKWIQFYDDAQTRVAQIIEYKNGEPNGYYEVYDQNKRLRMKVFLKNGEGISEKQWYANRQLKAKVLLENNTVFFEELWYEDGVRESQCRYLKENDKRFYFPKNVGENKQWYRDGMLKLHENYDSLGKRHGKAKYFYENGNLRRELAYVHGKATGMACDFFKDGSKRSCGMAANGLREGKWEVWHKNGQLLMQATYQQGTPVGKWSEWYKNGALAMEGAFKVAEFVWKDTADASLFESKTLAYSYQSGEWRYWYEDGSLMAKGVYESRPKDIVLDGGFWSIKTKETLVSNVTSKWAFFSLGGDQIKINKLPEKYRDLFPKDSFLVANDRIFY